MPDTTLLLSPLATNLHSRIQAAGLDRAAFARVTGIRRDTLDRLFAGRIVDLPHVDLAAAADYFGVAPTILTARIRPEATDVPAGANALHGHTLLPLRSIRRSDRNPRKHFDPEALQTLADSIRTNGIQQNLVVRYDPQPGEPDYAIVAGERRFRAAHLLANVGELDPDAPLIPVKIVDVDDARHTVLAILENLQRQDVNPLEEAQAFADLIALDPDTWGPSRISKEVGCSRRHVQLRLGLLEKLCGEAQDRLRSGTITIMQAYVLGTTTSQRQREILKNIDRYGTLQQLRDAVTDGLVPTTRAKFDLETFTGRLVTLDNGARYFADRDEFLAAQRAHGQALAERLKEGWAWAEFLEDTYFPSARFEAERSHDAGAGVLVLMHPVTGVITVHDQLMPRAPKPPAPVAPSRAAAASPAGQTKQLLVDFLGTDPDTADGLVRTAEAVGKAVAHVNDQTRRAQETETARFHTALSDRIKRDSRTAIAVLLADALRLDEGGLLEGTPSDDYGLPASVFRGPDGPLKHLAQHVTNIGRGRVALIEDTAAAEEALHGLMGTPMLLLLEALALWTADHLIIPEGTELPIAMRELAVAHAIPIPTHLRGGLTGPDHAVEEFRQDDEAEEPEEDVPAWADRERPVRTWDAPPAPAPAATPRVVCSSTGPIDAKLLERFAVAAAPLLTGKDLSVNLADSKVGLRLSLKRGETAVYDVSGYYDDRGCCFSWGCMSKTRVTAFLRAWLRQKGG
ncbi:ParB/RepB/Spo0J family partition protein [Azospirillum agricola]|uniref:ParB/RepB/Spo0J family partition protein n=1 Tax=Azospirillum agricola TaxID=1720247 RepID=UPI001AE2659E|nr:ParB/RepB/Spo0J family partition protein [Azospirillum agricola]MBP2233126.1 ParB/RepB/Spo0J family partition protein [Azospirillum agricola]